MERGQVFAITLVHLVQAVGSALSNEFWEAKLDPLKKITYESLLYIYNLSIEIMTIVS